MNAIVGELCSFIEGNGLAVDSSKYNQLYLAGQFDKARQSLVRAPTIVTTGVAQQITGFAAVTTPGSTAPTEIAAVLCAEGGKTASRRSATWTRPGLRSRPVAPTSARSTEFATSRAWDSWSCSAPAERFRRLRRTPA